MIKTLTAEHAIELGVASDFTMKADPIRPPESHKCKLVCPICDDWRERGRRYRMYPRLIQTDVPCAGLVTILDIRLGNLSLVNDNKRDLWSVDAFEYVHGEVLPLTIDTVDGERHPVVLRDMQYTSIECAYNGRVPDGFKTGDRLRFTVTFSEKD